MASRTRFRSSILMGRGGDQAAAATGGLGAVLCAQVGTVTLPAASAEALNVTLPKGARLEMVLINQSSIGGGTAPTVGVGSAADPDGIIDVFPVGNGGDAVYMDDATYPGALWVDPIAADTPLLAIDGDTGTPATAGSIKFTFIYWIDPANQVDPSGE